MTRIERDWQYSRGAPGAGLRGSLGIRREVSALGAAGPMRLSVDRREAQAAALAPRAGDGARTATQVRYHPAAAATGHTLPRLMGCPGQALAVVLIARHEAIRLATRA